MATDKRYTVAAIQKHLNTFRTVLPEGDAALFCKWLIDGAPVAKVNRIGPNGPDMVKVTQVIEWAAANQIVVKWEPEAGRLVFQASGKPAERFCTGCQSAGQVDEGFYTKLRGVYGAFVSAQGELANPDEVEACETCGVYEDRHYAVAALEDHLRAQRNAGAFG